MNPIEELVMDVQQGGAQALRDLMGAPERLATFSAYAKAHVAAFEIAVSQLREIRGLRDHVAALIRVMRATDVHPPGAALVEQADALAVILQTRAHDFRFDATVPQLAFTLSSCDSLRRHAARCTMCHPFGVPMLILLLACTSPCGRGTHDEKGLCVADTDDTGQNLDSADADTDADTDADSDADADTDTDTDTDSDSDTDSDTGTAPACDVAADGSATYTDIQAAVDAAADGDTIRVCAGSYTGFESSRYNLTIIGESGEDVTVVDGGAGPAVLVTDVSLTLSGLTLGGRNGANAAAALGAVDATVAVSATWFKGSEGDGALGVDQSGGSLTIEDSSFTDNGTNLLIYADGGGSLTIRNTVFSENRSNGLLTANATDLDFSNNLLVENAYLGFVLYIVGGSGTSQWVWNNTIYGNTSTCDEYYPPACPAIYAEDSSQIEDNIIADNNQGGVYVRYPDAVEFQYNDTSGNGVFDNYFVVGAGGVSDGYGTGNINSDPHLTDPSAGDYSLDGFSPCVDAGNPVAGYNDVDGTRNDMGAFGGPYGDWAP